MRPAQSSQDVINALRRLPRAWPVRRLRDVRRRWLALS